MVKLWLFYYNIYMPVFFFVCFFLSWKIIYSFHIFNFLKIIGWLKFYYSILLVWISWIMIYSIPQWIRTWDTALACCGRWSWGLVLAKSSIPKSVINLWEITTMDSRTRSPIFGSRIILFTNYINMLPVYHNWCCPGWKQ